MCFVYLFVLIFAKLSTACSLLYGDPTAPEDFQGGRDYASLSAFAKTFLDKPVCSVTKEDACDAEQKKLLHELKKKSKDELLSTVEEVESKLKAYQQDLDDFIDEINIQVRLYDPSAQYLRLRDDPLVS
jgi:hypothetical protein